MKKLLSLMLALVFAFSALPLVGSAEEAAANYVFGPKALFGEMIFSSEGVIVEQKAEGDKTFINCVAAPGQYANGSLQCSFAPLTFFMMEYPYVRVSYRTNSHSSVIDTTTRSSSAGESWGDSHPSCDSNEKWNDLYIDLNTIKGGGGLARTDEYVTLVLKPFGAGTQNLSKNEYFDIEYIAFFKTKAEAEAYKYEGEGDYVSDVSSLVENFFFREASEDDINKYLAEADKLVEEIKNSTTNVEVTGTKYYVSASGNDTNDGKSPDTPWRTIERVNKANLKASDGVFFKRGESFRTVESLNTVTGVTYSAYGDGAKPMIVASVDGGDADMWIETEYRGIYKFAEELPPERDVGTIVFDGGDAWGIQVQQTPKSNKRLANGNVYNGIEFSNDLSLSGKPWGTLDKMLVNNLEFYHDWDTNTLYLYSPNGNPAEIFESVEIVDKGHAISGSGVDVTIDNIAIFGTGSHGIGFGNVKNLEVRYCEFHWIGGSIQGKTLFDRDIGVRYGNAVESYGSSDNFKIHHCFASQVYDCCWTVQAGSGADMNNIQMYSNVSEFCNTGLEVWNSAGSITNMKLYDNYTRYNGYGWSHQRPNKDGNFFYGASATDNVYENNDVYNNVNLFAECNALLVAATGANQYNFHDNVYFMESNKKIGGISANPGQGVGGQIKANYNEENLKRFAATGFEPDSKFYYTAPNPFENMYDLYKNFVVPVETQIDITKIFNDIPENFWGTDAILKVYESALFGGVGDGNFAPNSQMTRAMLTVVLSRLGGYERKYAANKPYEDVAIPKWFSAAVEWAKMKGIVDAGLELFRPDDNITREEMADMLYNYAMTEFKADIKGKTIDAKDASEIGEEYKDGFIFCTDAKIITGYPDGTVNPKGEATRAEVATMIARFEKYMKTAQINEELASEMAAKRAKVFTPAELIDSQVLKCVGLTADVAEDGAVTFIAAAGAYKNNEIMLTITPTEFSLTDYHAVRIVYKSNSSSDRIDVSTRSERYGESWLGTHPVKIGDGTVHDACFDLTDLSGGRGPLPEGAMEVSLALKPFGNTVTLKDSRYFKIEKIVFAKNIVEAKYADVD